jgi:hypothetical protein
MERNEESIEILPDGPNNEFDDKAALGQAMVARPRAATTGHRKPAKLIITTQILPLFVELAECHYATGEAKRPLDALPNSSGFESQRSGSGDPREDPAGLRQEWPLPLAAGAGLLPAGWPDAAGLSPVSA